MIEIGVAIAVIEIAATAVVEIETEIETVVTIGEIVETVGVIVIEVEIVETVETQIIGTIEEIAKKASTIVYAKWLEWVISKREIEIEKEKEEIKS